MAEHGSGAITVERIAERSGVARSTIYRRWPDLPRLYFEAFRQLRSHDVHEPTGDTPVDLANYLRDTAGHLNDPTYFSIVVFLLAHAAVSEQYAQLHLELFDLDTSRGARVPEGHRGRLDPARHGRVGGGGRAPGSARVHPPGQAVADRRGRRASGPCRASSGPTARRRPSPTSRPSRERAPWLGHVGRRGTGPVRSRHRAVAGAEGDRRARSGRPCWLRLVGDGEGPGDHGVGIERGRGDVASHAAVEQRREHRVGDGHGVECPRATGRARPRRARRWPPAAGARAGRTGPGSGTAANGGMRPSGTPPRRRRPARPARGRTAPRTRAGPRSARRSGRSPWAG